MSQIKAAKVSEYELKLFIKQNNFFAGILNLKKRVFYHVPRSSRNLFHLFGKPGLGINEEILLRKDFDLIKVKFQDEILTTNRINWLKKGIVSPYCNQLVDKQIILMLENINLEETKSNEPQLTIFESKEVVYGNI